MWFNQFCATNSYSIVMWLMSITAFLNYSCNIQVIKSLNHHNHGENPVLVELSEISSQVKRAATQSMERPVQVCIFYHSGIRSVLQYN